MRFGRGMAVTGLVLALVASGCSKGPTVSHRATTTVVAPTRSTVTSTTNVGSHETVPTLGQLVGVFEKGEGFGQVKPSIVFNGGDPTGYVGDVVWSTWGGSSATGSGVSTYLAPNQFVSQGTSQPVTIVAFNLGTCDGKVMYRAVEWYFSQHGQTFDSKHYEDICTGQYVDLTCLSYAQATDVFHSSGNSTGDEINEVTCHGPSWAVGFITARGSLDAIGSAAFHLVSGRWMVVGSFFGTVTNPPSASVAAYCNALAQQGAPADMRCQV